MNQQAELFDEDPESELDPEWLEYRDSVFAEGPGSRLIISLFDESGAWTAPYREAGYPVYHFDLERGEGFGWTHDIRDFSVEYLTEELGIDLVYGILAAPPCTDFTVSGAQYWPAKDADGRTEASLELVDRVGQCAELFSPRFWVIENPVGRLQKLRPGLGRPLYVEPWHFGDAYTKKTGLWGRFNRELPRNEVEPIRACKAGSWLMQLGGSSERTKRLRSQTPPGLARAFFEVNQ